MNYIIASDIPNRIRIRLGRYAFTKEEGYSLIRHISSMTGVNKVDVNSSNGSILVKCDCGFDRNAFFYYINSLSRDTLQEVELTSIETMKEMERDFRVKALKMVTNRVLRRMFVPLVIRRILCIVRSAHFLKLGVNSLSQGKMNVELLDATAIGTALACGKFKTASSTMFLLRLSDLLLDYSNARAKNALTESLAINISKVWLVKGNVEEEVSIDSVKIGDIVRIRTGAMLPLDGTVFAGEGMINESTMTGEPLSVHKKVGGTVFAGTVLEEGTIDIKVTALTGDSRVSKIVEMIDTGEKLKANIQSKAERLADGIVPITRFLRYLGYFFFI